MREIPVELTPQALAQIRRWLLLLAGDDKAPAWDPGENHDTPESLQAAARWLVDNGHGGAMGDQLVAVLLALFSMNLRWRIEAEIEGRFIPHGADDESSPGTWCKSSRSSVSWWAAQAGWSSRTSSSLGRWGRSSRSGPNDAAER